MAKTSLCGSFRNKTYWDFDFGAYHGRNRIFYQYRENALKFNGFGHRTTLVTTKIIVAQCLLYSIHTITLVDEQRAPSVSINRL